MGFSSKAFGSLPCIIWKRGQTFLGQVREELFGGAFPCASDFGEELFLKPPGIGFRPRKVSPNISDSSCDANNVVVLEIPAVEPHSVNAPRS